MTTSPPSLFSPRGSPQVTAQLPWEQASRRKNSPEHQTATPYAVSNSLGWVAHQVWKQEWEVVVYLIFLRVTRVACQLHSFSHSLFLFLSPAQKPIFTRTLVDICSHIFSLSASLHSVVLSHSIFLLFWTAKHRCNPICVCVCKWDSICFSSSDCCDPM